MSINSSTSNLPVVLQVDNYLSTIEILANLHVSKTLDWGDQAKYRAHSSPQFLDDYAQSLRRSSSISV